MGASGGFPVELILFGMIAAFLVLRLRGILGKRQGFERPPEARPAIDPNSNVVPHPMARVGQGRVIDVTPEPVSRHKLPDPVSALGQTLTRMTGIEPGFDPSRFLDGAEGAFRLIVAAYAAGHREQLRPLLSDEMYAAFESAIAAREQAGETQRTEIQSIFASTIEAADLRGALAILTVKFISNQVNVTMGKDGLPVAGADAVTEITDLWTFERQLGSADPTWRLVSARSA
jgi:predicted lipid-binding transport protein (Tim44 family)